MRSRRALPVLAALVLLALPANAAPSPQSPAVESRRYEIALAGERPYKSVQLKADLYNQAAEDLANLRVVDQDGNMVPYLLYDSAAEHRVQEDPTPGALTGSFQKEGDSYHDFAIQRTEGVDPAGSHLRLSTSATGFAKEVEILGGYDGRKWEPVGGGLFYSVAAGQNSEIPLGGERSFSHYRVRVLQNAEKIPIEAVTLIHRREEDSLLSFEESFSPQYTAEEAEGETRLLLPPEQLRGLRLVRLELETASMFRRQVKTPMGEGTLYNLVFQEHALRNTALPLPGRPYRGEEPFAVVIENADDAPILVEGLTLVYQCDRLVFKAEPGKTYSLLLDGGQREKPTYDMASYREHVLAEGADPCGYAPAQVTAEPLASNGGKRDAWLLNGILILASLLLIGVIVRTGLSSKG